MADADKKQSLILTLREARAQLGENLVALRRDVSIGQRFRNSVRKHPVAWYAGAAVLGLLIAKIPPFGRKVVVPQPVVLTKAPKAGLAAAILTGLKLTLDIGRPFLTNWIKEKMHEPERPAHRVKRARYTSAL